MVNVIGIIFFFILGIFVANLFNSRVNRFLELNFKFFTIPYKKFTFITNKSNETYELIVNEKLGNSWPMLTFSSSDLSDESICMSLKKGTLSGYYYAEIDDKMVIISVDGMSIK